MKLIGKIYVKIFNLFYRNCSLCYECHGGRNYCVKVVVATIFPRSSGILTDIVSLRKTLPLGYTMEDNDNFEAHMQARKLFPSLQAKSSTLNVTKSSNTSIEFQFRPTNCSSGFNAFSLVNSFSDVSLIFQLIEYLLSSEVGNFHCFS